VKKHESSEEVQSWGALALGNLAGNAESQVKIAAADGIQVIITGMKKREASEEMRMSAANSLDNLKANPGKVI
jgi:hypothetical protein